MINLTEDEFDYLMIHSFPTGSRLYGGAVEASDYDVVIREVDFVDEFEEEYEDMEYEESNSVKFKWKDKIINAIVVDEAHYKKWEKTTDLMVNIYDQFPYLTSISKVTRVEIFKTIFDNLEVLDVTAAEAVDREYLLSECNPKE